ncbi:unnamed protein product [Urochloa humidicola]
MLVTVSVNVLPCDSSSSSEACEGPINGTRFAASLNNVSFMSPAGADVLDAYYSSVGGVYELDFPDRPPVAFNFTEAEPATELWFTKRGTRVKVVEYGAVVEVGFQGTSPSSAPSRTRCTCTATLSTWWAEGSATSTRTGTRPSTTWWTRRTRTPSPCPPAGGPQSASGPQTLACGLCTATLIVTRCGEWTVFIVKNGKTPETQMMPRPPSMPMC